MKENIMEKNKLMEMLCKIMVSIISVCALNFNYTYGYENAIELLECFEGDFLILIIQLMFVLLSFSVIESKKKEEDINQNYCVVGATILSICFVLGKNFEKYGLIINDFRIKSLILLLMIIVGYMIILNNIFCIIALHNWGWLIKGWSLGEYSNKYKLFMKLFCPIYSVSILWYIKLSPGIVTYDSYNQIAQAVGWIEIANNNPILHTLLMSTIINPIYLLTGNIILAVRIFQFVSVTILSIISTYVFYRLIRMRMNGCITLICYAGFLANPLYGVYSNIIWKDIWISYFTMLFTVECVHAMFHVGIDKYFKIKKYVLIFFIATLGVLAFKGTGIIFITFMAGTIFCSKNSEKYKMVAMLVVCIISFYTVQTITVKALDATPHSSEDTMCCIWQSIARTIKEHKEELTNEEKAFVSQFMDIDTIGDLYNSQVADPVKAQLDFESFERNKIKNLIDWIKLGIKYPLSYVNAFFGSAYGYLYPDVYYWCYTSDSYMDTVLRYIDYGIEFDPNGESYLYETNELDETIGIVNMTRKIPIVCWLSSVGAYFVGILVLFIYCKARKYKKISVMFVIPFAVFISCILSPVFAEMRYGYPAVVSTGIFAVLTMYGEMIEKDGLLKCEQ